MFAVGGKSGLGVLAAAMTGIDPDRIYPFREPPMAEPTGVKRKLAVILAAIVAVSRAVASWQH